MITNGGSSTGTNIAIRNMQQQTLLQQNTHSTEISNNNERLDTSDKIIVGGFGVLFMAIIVFALFMND